MPDGRSRKINNDASKLLFACGLGTLQRRLLADFRFRCSAIPGTQEVRAKIEHLGFWAGINYGNAIFCTLSPGERHNYLALRLSRYRQNDPFVSYDSSRQQWARKDSPSLEPSADDVFEVDIPGYETRRLYLAEDPLAAANAFFIQIRTVLATMLGVRMCPRCPHCSHSSSPCQDALGSNAEAMGGIAGRVDALFGAVEAQKTTGGLHFHFFMFVQRVHQSNTIKDIAKKIEENLINAEELKHFLGQICCERYPDLQQFTRERQALEKNFPRYAEGTECTDNQVWGDWKLGRLPGFLYDDARAATNWPASATEERDTAEGCTIDDATFKTKFNCALQYFMSRCQHHIHRLVTDPKTKQEKRVIPNACMSKKIRKNASTERRGPTECPGNG